MKNFFLPAITLMNRFSYNRKFMLLALISVCAIGMMAFNFFVSLDKEIRAGQRKLDGLALFTPIFHAVQLAQRHRALDTVLIMGTKSMRGEHDAVRKAAVDALIALEAQLPDDLKAAMDWEGNRRNWALLHDEGSGWTVEENFAAHTRMIAHLLRLQNTIADEYGLILDSDARSYYLIDVIVNDLPHVIEHLGQLRAQGLARLIDRRIADPQRIRTGTVINELGDALESLDANLKKAMRYNPAMRESLQGAFTRISASVEQVSALMEVDILSGRFALTPGEYYAVASVVIDDSYRQLHKTLLTATDTLLRERLTRATYTLYATMGAAALLLLAVAYFAIGIYYSIIGSVHALARSAHTFAEGDTNERVRLDARDELGEIGDSFNRMADGFETMLAARNRAEASLQESLSRQTDANRRLGEAQRRAAEALDELQVMLDTSGEGFWKVDMSGNIIEVNDAYCGLTGYARTEIVGAHISRFDAIEQTPDAVAEHVRRIVEQGHDRFETRHRHQDGHLIDIEVVASFILGTRCLIVFLRDVTERNQAAKALRESETKYSRLHESMRDAFVMVDMSGRLIEFNHAYQEMLGYHIEELQRLTYVDLTPQKWHEFEAKIVSDQVMPHDRSQVYEKEYIRKDGTVFPVELKTFLLRGKDNQPEAMWAVVRDITERKRTEEVLRRSETKFRTIYESSSDGIMLLDGNGFIDCNDAALKVFGYNTREDFLGRHPAQFSPPAQPGGEDSASLANAHIATAFKNGSHWFEWMHCRLDGTEFPASVLLTSMELDGRQVLQSTVRDITVRKKVEESLRKSNEELAAANRRLEEAQSQLLQSEKMASIGQLAAGVAHEINNPIGYVYSNLGTLERYVQDLLGMLDRYEQSEAAIGDEAARARLKAAREQLDIGFLKQDLGALMGESKDGITRVKQIVQNLKDFSHVDAADEWRFADLHKGLDSTLNIVHNEIKYKADVVKAYGDLPEVECLPSQLNQVFMNLLVNAAHAIEERGTITLRSGRQGEEVWIEIADSGKGIAAEHLNKIFDPFFTTKPVGKGTGLGLSLSYGIMQKHHGRIEVQSEVGRGTAFRVWLPLRRVTAEPS